MKRYYVRVSSFSLGKVLMALLNDSNVEEVCVSLEDSELLVSFSETEKAICDIHKEPTKDKKTNARDVITPFKERNTYD